MQGIGENLVLGVIKGYKYASLAPFVESYLKVMTDSSIVLFGDIDRGTFKLLTNKSVNLMPLANFLPDNITLADGRIDKVQNSGSYIHNQMHIVRARYLVYLNFLKSLKTLPKNIILSDVSDVVFQLDPFKMMENNELVVLKEYHDKKIGECEIHKRWIIDQFGDEVYHDLRKKQIVNSGLIFGTSQGVLNLLTNISEILWRGNPCGFDDQGLFNYLIHSNKIQVVIEGKDSELGVITRPSERLIFKVETLVNSNGLPYAMIHQFDRHYRLSRIFK